MSLIVTDLLDLYDRTFGSRPYHVTKAPADITQGFDGFKIADSGGKDYTSEFVTNDGKGVEIWLPIYLDELPKEVGDNGRLFLPYATVKLSGSTTQIKTPLAERIGTAKEQYNVDDYKITIKGFFIDKEKRMWPGSDLKALKKINEIGRAFKIENAITDIFLTFPSLPPVEQKRVVITSFDLPEVSGGRKHVKPFIMTLESDCVFTLEVE